MENLKDIFNIVKLEKLCSTYTDINVRGGLYHRINGKATVTGKSKELTDEDKTKLKEGLELFITDVKKVLKTIK